MNVERETLVLMSLFPVGSGSNGFAAVFGPLVTLSPLQFYTHMKQHMNCH